MKQRKKGREKQILFFFLDLPECLRSRSKHIFVSYIRPCSAYQKHCIIWSRQERGNQPSFFAFIYFSLYRYHFSIYLVGVSITNKKKTNSRHL